MQTLDNPGIESNILGLRTMQSMLGAAEACKEHGRKHLAICPECLSVRCTGCAGGDTLCYCDVDPDWEGETD
jgi:hypothetical protein